MKHFIMLSLMFILIVNASLISYGQKIQFSKRKYGLLNQSRVGRRNDVNIERYGRRAGVMNLPRVGRSDSSLSKFDQNNENEMDTLIDFDAESEPMTGLKHEREGNDYEVLVPFYVFPDRRLWFRTFNNEQR